MTQYCRYCCYCMTANGNWCEAKEKTLTEAQIKRTNHCKQFEFTPLDAFDWHKEYKPRPPKPKAVQLDNVSLFDENMQKTMSDNKKCRLCGNTERQKKGDLLWID